MDERQKHDQQLCWNALVPFFAFWPFDFYTDEQFGVFSSAYFSNDKVHYNKAACEINNNWKEDDLESSNEESYKAIAFIIKSKSGTINPTTLMICHLVEQM